MDSLSIICIVIGILAIVIRGPLIFAPRATLRFYDRLILSSNARVRAVGVANAILAIALLLLPSLNEGALASLLYAFGWITAAEALWVVVLPDSARRVGSAIYSFLENSVSAPVFSVLRVLAGLGFVYLGVYVV